MMNVMKRAWEIYRTLEGNHYGKLSFALKQAWAEKKNGVKNMINAMISKYDIKLMGEKIGVTAPKYNKNMDELNWIKDHKPEIVEELKRREAEKAARKKAWDKAYSEFAAIEPDIKRASQSLQYNVISGMVNKGITAEQILPYFRSLYADERESRI